MWSASQRLKAMNKAKSDRAGADVPRYHLRRVKAEVKLLDEDSLGQNSVKLDARVILNEFVSQGVTLYLPQPIMVGQKVAFTLEHPKRFYAKARVVGVQESESSGHIIQATQFLYRVVLQFLFSNPAEAAQIQRFASEIYHSQIQPGAGNFLAAEGGMDLLPGVPPPGTDPLSLPAEQALQTMASENRTVAGEPVATETPLAGAPNAETAAAEPEVALPETDPAKAAA